MQERSEMEDLGKINYFCTEHGLLQQNSIEEQSPFISQAQPKQNTQHQLPSSDTDLNVRSLPTDQRIQEIRNIRELTEKFLCGHSSQFNIPGEGCEEPEQQQQASCGCGSNPKTFYRKNNETCRRKIYRILFSEVHQH